MQQEIAVTGANGQLGKELKQLASSYPQPVPFRFIFLSREDMSIDNAEQVKKFFKTNHPHYLINCAAYTAVDRAESEKDLAFRVNGEAAGVLAATCKEYNTKFIHISTDYVFDGTATVPYPVDSPTHPQTVYGASKLEGEHRVLNFNPGSIIIRTSWVYSAFGKNFVKTMLKLMNEKTEISVVNDQVGSPTYAADLAEAILTIISSGKWQQGIYHYSNEGIISWYDFAAAIKELTGSNCKINPIATSEYPTPAKRPVYSVLNKIKIQETFGIALKDWKKSLALCLSRIKSSSLNL